MNRLLNLPGVLHSAALCALLGLFAASPLAAQDAGQSTDELMTLAQNAAQFLTDLDATAQSCLDEQSAATDEQSATAECDSFMALLDGAALIGYLDDCQTLTAWRDEFVTRNNEQPSSNLDSQQYLQLLVAVEYACTADVMEKRTTAVIPAFGRLREQRLAGAGESRELTLLRQQAAQSTFEFMEARERQLQMRQMRQTQSRVVDETDELMDDLELELIRQQIDNR
ncbi:MAG: hypothetical protein ACR2PR_00715 [Pseudohongiellaceae bacterium]